MRTLLSKKSRALIKVFALPCALAHVDLDFFKAASQDCQWLACFARRGILRCKLLQILANQSGESGVAIDGDFSHLLYEFVVEGERDVHIHIIRETVIMGNL